jgi:hypothetical protein
MLIGQRHYPRGSIAADSEILRQWRQQLIVPRASSQKLHRHGSYSHYTAHLIAIRCRATITAFFVEHEADARAHRTCIGVGPPTRVEPCDLQLRSSAHDYMLQRDAVARLFSSSQYCALFCGHSAGHRVAYRGDTPPFKPPSASVNGRRVLSTEERCSLCAAPRRKRLTPRANHSIRPLQGGASQSTNGPRLSTAEPRAGLGEVTSSSVSTHGMLVLHDRKSRVILAARLSGNTAAETIFGPLTVIARIEPASRSLRQ